jgi:hypothetical protein
LFDRICFPNLPYSPENKGLTPPAFLPFIKFKVNESSHAIVPNRSDSFKLQGYNKGNDLKIQGYIAFIKIQVLIL